MEVTRAREKEQRGRELRRSLKAATVVLYSGGMESVWVAAGRKGEKGGGAARAWQKVRPHVRAVEVEARCERRVEMKKMSGWEDVGEQQNEWTAASGRTDVL
jgi:hypothetical protein